MQTGKLKGLQIEMEGERYAYERQALKLELKILDHNSDWNVYDEDRPTSKGLELSVGSRQEVGRSNNKYSVTADVTTDAPYTAKIDLKIPMRKWDKDKLEYGNPKIVRGHISIDASASGKRSRATIDGDDAVIDYLDPALPF